MTNYFAAESLILQRLQTLADDFRLITTGRSLKEIQEHPAPTPALYLIYDGQKSIIGAGKQQAIDQQWLVVIAVRSARDRISGAHERLEAGPLLIKICETLIGWQPDTEYGPLGLGSAPGPLHGDGMGYYPALFYTRMVLKGQ